MVPKIRLNCLLQSNNVNRFITHVLFQLRFPTNMAKPTDVSEQVPHLDNTISKIWPRASPC